jgi:hypothetical protein
MLQPEQLCKSHMLEEKLERTTATWLNEKRDTQKAGE